MKPWVKRVVRCGWILAVLGVFACKQPPTQLMVMVGSDIAVPAVLTRVEVDVRVNGGAEVVSTFDVTGGPGSRCTESACPLPLSLGVVSASNDAVDPVVIMVRGIGPSGLLVVRTVRTQFVTGRRLAVPVFLGESCRDAMCGPDSTCDGGACVTDVVDPRTLQEVPKGFDPARLFPDRSRDAAIQIADADTPVTPDSTLADAVGGARPDARPPQDGGVSVDAASPMPMLDWVRSTVASLQQLEFLRTEVTVDQYSACVASGACGMDTFRTSTLNPGTCNLSRTDRGDHPVNCVYHIGARAFCQWVGGRLPTEEEWYAEASNGGMWNYPWGDEAATCSYAVVAEGGDTSCGEGHRTWPVCSKRMGDSVSGLCDLLGNVYEATMTMADEQVIVRGLAYLTEPIASVGLQWRRRETEIAYPWGGFRCVRPVGG